MIYTAPPNAMFVKAQDDLQRAGIKLQIVPGGFLVNRAGSPIEKAFVSEDLTEAINAGRELARTALARLPTMGPIGRPNSGRALMYRHNRRLAAFRRRIRVKP